MMDEESSFFQVLENLNGLSNKRDPRLLRLASVTAALKDVSGGDPSAAKFFAAAVETLEGTLHQKHQEADTILDSLSTQTALLDIISLTIAHVAPATLAATASLSSRALRGVVHSWQSFGIQEAQSVIFDTQDGLGGISSLLCISCKAVSGLLRHLPIAADDNTIANLIRSTLLSLLKDSRPRVKSAATSELCGLLAMDLPKCHNIVHKETTKYVKKEMERSLKSTVEEEASRDLVDLLGFLQHAIIFIDFTTIGTHLMEVLISLFAACSSSSSNRPVFVTKLGDTRRQILTINSILSTILAMLEHEVSGPKEKTLCVFASRVLASLVQVQPTLAYRHGEVENDLLESGRSIFGQVMLSSCERLFTGGEVETASKLLPLTIHHVVNLSRPSDSLLDNEVAETLMPELSQLLRMQLRDLKTTEPVVHEKCCRDSLTAMEIVLQSSFQPTWMVSLKPLVILLQQMNPRNEKVQVCIETMLILRCQISEDTNFHHSIDDAISSLVQEIGIEQFWDQIKLSDLSLSTDERSAKGGIMKNLQWLLQLMKSAGSLGGRYDLHLSFFQNTILPLARHYDSQSMKNAPKAALYKRKVLALWGLFPCFCRKPVDLVSSFPKFVPLLVRAMNDKRYPELVILICNGLKILSAGISDRYRSVEELFEGEEVIQIRREAQLLGKLSEKLIPSLFKLVETLHVTHRSAVDEHSGEMTNGDEGKVDKVDDASRVRAVTEAIAALAQLASKELVQSLFSKVLKRLLEASQAEDDLSEKMCSLLTLSQALVISESLDHSSISLLYRSLKPLIRTDETKPRIQKRAYKVLAEICNRCGDFVRESKQLNELLEVLTSSMATSQISSRFMRIKCLTMIVKSLEDPSEKEKQLILGLLAETLLSLKDSNAKTREAAFGLLLSMAKIQEDLGHFIRSLMAAVGSTTSHMRSAAVVALSRVVFEYSVDGVVQSLLPSMLRTILVLSDDPSREVVKSFVGFVRVAVVVIPADHLRPLLPDILHSLLKYHRGKDRFRSKIKIIIKKLVKLFGYEALVPIVPQSESRLLTHMRKLSERETRQKMARRAERKSEAFEFDDMIASDEEDSDDGRTLFTGATGMSRTTKRSQRTGSGKRSIAHETQTKYSAGTQRSKADVSLRIRNDTDGTKFDVGDLTQKTVRFAESHSDDSDSESPIEFDSSGKLIIIDDAEQTHNSMYMTESSVIQKGGTIGRKESNRGSGSNSNKDARRNQKPKNSQKLGSAYKAKTAGGDVKKKGQKYDPYAYVPLDGRSYTKKNRHRAVEQMSTVVRRGRKRQKR